ncbi:peptidase C14, caspase domain-containing protein [Epithele typhae]|uniref:peptidase C14, caspase domain-containing protein n=1 Tax=Epithele typhae TaxID=378194 RepID=UPI0020074A11|nr:peptidase C14, caspase domain-containing protein [Epithele typhae]KAH9942137.1 peptidase C14, caspase domain-containing protein [Epithele typhae]
MDVRVVVRKYHGCDNVNELRPISTHHPEGQNHFFQYSKCSGRRRAVCIGVNYLGQDHPLRGCINDARNVRRFLLNRRFANEDIFMLTDDATDPRAIPTRVNILDAMHWLVTGAHPHDSLFFHYSGHGSQVPSKTGDEVDSMDEIIFPVDYQKAGYILDDLIHKVLVASLPVGCRLTAIFDSCHSGSVMDVPYTYSQSGYTKKGGVTAEWFDRNSSPADVICWSGCSDTQTSADTFEDGSAVGAMSWAFMSSLRDKPDQSYQELLASIRTLLKDRYSQIPQLSSSHEIDTNLKFII